MKLLKRIWEYFAFTKNEQKVFLFLGIVMVVGAVLRLYQDHMSTEKQFDYSRSNSVFAARSKGIEFDTISKHAPVLSVKKVNINTASKHELMQLPGIGDAMAERIILFRTENKRFTTVDELRKVKGIGDKKFEKLKNLIEK